MAISKPLKSTQVTSFHSVTSLLFDESLENFLSKPVGGVELGRHPWGKMEVGDSQLCRVWKGIILEVSLLGEPNLLAAQKPSKGQGITVTGI